MLLTIAKPVSVRYCICAVHWYRGDRSHASLPRCTLRRPSTATWKDIVEACTNSLLLLVAARYLVWSVAFTSLNDLFSYEVFHGKATDKFLRAANRRMTMRATPYGTQKV